MQSMPYDDDSFASRPLDRRTFIKRGVAFVGAGAMTPPAFLRAVFDEQSLPVSTTSALTDNARRVLVVLQLGGGNDGLNTVIPVGDPAYAQARPTLAINTSSALSLGNGLALNPAMTGMKTLFDRGQLGVVLGVGYPDPSRSHFRSMDIWHAASFEEHSETGWIGRLLDATKHEQDSLWRAANLGAEEPLSLASRSTFVPSVGSVPGYVLQTDGRLPKEAAHRTQDFVSIQTRQAEALAQQAAYGGQLAFLSKTGLEAYQSTVNLQTAVKGYASRTTYPNTPLASALSTASQLISSDLGTGVCYVTTGGFDTHGNQSGTQNNLLGIVSDALFAFYEDLGTRGRANDVTTLVWTEFGRRVKENGSRGTDHGTAGPVFIVGGGVTGGLHGEQPSVGSLDDNGDLKFTTDFRSVYASIIAQRFGADPRDVLGQSFAPLPLFA